MPNFKIGDYVTGTEDCPYNITSKNAICIVINMDPYSENNMQVKIVKEDPYHRGIGSEWSVKSRYFRKVYYAPGLKNAQKDFMNDIGYKF